MFYLLQYTYSYINTLWKTTTCKISLVASDHSHLVRTAIISESDEQSKSHSHPLLEPSWLIWPMYSKYMQIYQIHYFMTPTNLQFQGISTIDPLAHVLRPEFEVALKTSWSSNIPTINQQWTGQTLGAMPLFTISAILCDVPLAVMGRHAVAPVPPMPWRGKRKGRNASNRRIGIFEYFWGEWEPTLNREFDWFGCFP